MLLVRAEATSIPYYIYYTNLRLRSYSSTQQRVKKKEENALCPNRTSDLIIARI
jgi:hypothetical protein